ncbi:hypothetical protein ACFC4S_26520 [Priestia megaterium]|uniref:hypothetical protein n=1 Tax=Priestia megaterium TaxID=1404 RepID=UPI0035E09CE5
MKRILTKNAKRKIRQGFFLSTFSFLAIVIIVAIKLFSFSSILFLIPLLIIRMMLVKRYKRDCYILENGITKEAYLSKYGKTGTSINDKYQYAAYFKITHNATEITVIDKTFYKEKLQDDYKYTLYYSPKYPKKCIILEFRDLTAEEAFSSDQGSANSSLKAENKQRFFSNSKSKKDSNSGSPFL